MRIFYKMKKVLLVAAALFAVNVAFAESKTVNYIQNDADNKPGTETVNVSLDAISFSYLGDANGWDVKSNKQNYSGNSYTHYVSGKSNPTVTDGVPTAGSVFGFVPKYDGQFALCIVVNGNKATYVLEDGVGLSSFDVDGKWNTDGSVADTTIASGGKLKDKCYGTITFDVKADKQYYVYCTGSKMGYYGFSYTYEETTVEEPAVPAVDSLKADVVTELVAGHTYVLGAQYDMCKVKFTAPADGFLNITPSQKVNSTNLKINGASSTFTKVDGGISKKGMAKGSVFEGTFYTSGTPSVENTYALVVTFEEGTPYEPLAMTLANPVQGGEWSGAAQYKSYGTKGVPHFEFSSIISADVVASIKIGDKVYTPVKCTVDGYNPKLDITAMPDTMNVAIAAGLIKAGESFTLTLSNIVDKEFTANTMKDTTFTYTLASTACTGVTPAASTSRQVLPEEVVFSFDGAVLIDNAKFYYVNKNSGEKTELTGTVDGTSVKIAVTGIEGMLPKLYDIVAEGVTDANGKVITYGETVGQLTVSYGTSNGYFKAVASPANYENVASLKTYTFTLPGDLVFDDSQASTNEITFGKYDEASYSFVAIEGVTVSYAIEANVLTVTLSEEITTPGDYQLSVPSKMFWSKDLYDKDNLSTSTCYYLTSQYISNTILAYGPTTVAPANGSTLNKIEKLVLSFDEPVDFADTAKVVVNMYQEIVNDWGWTDYAEVAIAEYGLEYDYENENNIIVNVGSIDSAGMYSIVIPEGSIWTVANKDKKIGEWKYEYIVDPNYWDPEWIVEVGANCTEEAPYQLIVDRKYELSEMYSYLQYTADETGRLYITPLSEGCNDWSQHDADWVYMGNLKETEDGLYWVGVAEGETYNIQNYGFVKRQFKLTFVAGNPYEDLEYFGSSPEDGGIYSKSTQAEYSYDKGSIDFLFSDMVNDTVLKVSVVLPAQENKEIDITEDAFFEVASVYGVGARVTVDMRDIVEDLKAQQGVKTGDKIQVVLKNIQDAAFEANKLAEEVKVELTLAATVCTSVNPGNDWDVEAIPTELSLQFDGAVTCAEGKGYIIDLANTENKQEFEIKDLATEAVENWDGSMVYKAAVTLPEATITLSSRRFAVELQGLVDAEGNAVSYGSEMGKFVIEYTLSAETLVPVSPSEDDYMIEVEAMKTTTLTFAEEVVVSPNAYVYFYISDYEEVVGELAVDANDPKSVVITWEKEITKPGAYNVTIESGSIYNSKFDADAEDFGVEKGATYNPYLSYYYSIPANVSATTVVSVTPEPYAGMFGTPIGKLPEQVVFEFDGNVKEVISAYGQDLGLGGGGWSLDDDMAEGDTEEPAATALETKLEGNKLYVTIPQEAIEAITFGYYGITINAIGEDDKPIGYVIDSWGDLDPYAEYISFSYYVMEMLEVVEMTPAANSVVKQLDKVTITFDKSCAVTEDLYICLWDENYDYAAEVNATVEGNVATLTFEPAVTAAGNYMLYIGESSFATEDYVGNTTLQFDFAVDPDYVDALALVSATPENGTTVEGLTQVEIKLNKEVGYLYKGMLIPADGADDAHYASLTKSETDPTVYTLDFTLLHENGVKLRKDVTYTMTLEAYVSEEAWNQNGACETVELTYVGAYEGFKYSDVTFEGITPAEDFVISDKSQNKFVVKFSGAVNMVEELTFINMGQGATQAFESIVANDAKTEYTLTIAESVLATLRSEVYIIFAANDESGKRVQGNNGEEEASCFAFTYKTTIGVPDLTVTPDAAAEQASLNVITIGCADGLVPSWTAGNITLTDANGNAIALNDPEAVVAEGADEWATPTAWTVALANELTEIGTYTLTIPAGYFNIGSTQGQVMGSKETVVVFNITQAAKDAAGINAITVDADVVVYNVAGVAVANGKASEVLKNLNKGIYIVNGKKFVVK